jgi:hypothetical protein
VFRVAVLDIPAGGEPWIISHQEKGIYGTFASRR